MRVVVLRRKRQHTHGQLEREEAGIAVYPPKQFQLIAQEVIHPRPSAHVQHAARQIRALHRDLLADARADAHQTHEVNVFQSQVIEERNRISRMQCHGGRHGRIVGGIANTSVIEDDDLIAIGETARQIAKAAMAVGAPPAHREHGIASAMHLVIHVVAVQVN